MCCSNPTCVVNVAGYFADDEIRQAEGFKNVSLGNVLAANSAIKKVTFLNEEDQVMVFSDF